MSRRKAFSAAYCRPPRHPAHYPLRLVLPRLLPPPPRRLWRRQQRSPRSTTSNAPPSPLVLPMPQRLTPGNQRMFEGASGKPQPLTRVQTTAAKLSFWTMSSTISHPPPPPPPLLSTKSRHIVAVAGWTGTQFAGELQTDRNPLHCAQQRHGEAILLTLPFWLSFVWLEKAKVN